ncbi:tyrosine--tRNA ligase [Buchnera aphidicola (Neophyllaphis podocarpi)]|uniref:tyrosine--tRNA ligase n=1 Tax=Buchnera aphidicola TaxID=9 RepID=UPI0031B83AC1
MKNILDDFRSRNLIYQISNYKYINLKLLHNSIKLYCGFDPTSDSLHVGHLLPIICLKRFQIFNHKPIILLGGATSLIGDPSFKNKERKLFEVDKIISWSKNINNQLNFLFRSQKENNQVTIINNYNWFKKINLLEFLRDVGKIFSISKLINKDSVKQRINRLDQGISFAEFSYNLLQSYDFFWLRKKYGVILQIGGSDQWGNITSGIYLTRRLYNKKVFGLTMPLILKSNGIKFGKSENDNIWLDSNKTSPYKFYQFWINVSDSNVFNFLKFFTFIDILYILSLEQNQTYSNIIIAKSLLAYEITKLVHGKIAAESAKRISNNIFYNNISDFLESDFEQLKQDGMPKIFLHGHEDLCQVLVDSNLVMSRSHAKNMIESSSIYINNRKETNYKYIFDANDKLFKKYTILKKGKKNFCLLCW